jgi:hypothetical protein
VYTDIHAHLLPGVDDGPATLEESLRAIDLMVEENITQIIITCHWTKKGLLGWLWHPLPLSANLRPWMRSKPFTMN